MNLRKMLIAGGWRLGSDDVLLKSPYSGEELAIVSSANEDELLTSIRAADDRIRMNSRSLLLELKEDDDQVKR
jgi:hypothetical protein